MSTKAPVPPPSSDPNDETVEVQKKKPFWITRTMAEHFSRGDVLCATLREGLLYCIFTLAVILSTEGKKDYSMYYLTKALKGQFVEREFLTVNDVPIEYKAIKTSADFWKFFKSQLLDGLYWENYYDPYNPVGTAEKDDQKILYENKILGVPRLRQVKVKSDSCKVQPSFQKLIKKCYAAYTTESEERAPFGNRSGTAWNWASEEDTGSLAFSGSYSKYYGGGYYQDLTSEKNSSRDIIDGLYKSLWVTRGTRAIFVDFSVYNANLNLICICKLIFEFAPTGGIVPSHDFLAILLDAGIHSPNFMSVFSEVVVYVFLLFFIAEEIREIMYFKKNYLFSFWTYMDLTIIALVFANFLTSIALLPDVPAAIKKIADNQSKYGNLEYIGEMKKENNDICAILLFFSIIKIFKYLNFNKTMGQINNTLKRCTWDLLCFIYMFLIIFIAYALLGHLLFGSQVDDFCTFPDAMFTLLRTILGDFNYQDIEQADRFMAPIFFISFIFFVFFILLNMFLAIINDTYADVKTEIAIAPEEMGLLEFIKIGFFDLLRRCGCKLGKRAEKKETNVTIRQIREAFKKCGFSDLEIEMFFARFNIDPLANVVHYDTKKILKELEALNASAGKVDDNVYVQLNDFLEQQERLDRIENSINLLAKRLEALVGKLNELEAERKNRANKG